LVSEAPPFWWEPADWRGKTLAPAAWVYGRVAAHRLNHAPRKRVAAPVLCVGNFTVGGSGKTPVAITLANAAREAGLKPGFLSRGYGGKVTGVHIVDPMRDTVHAVGDEPKLLATYAPTVVAPDRGLGANALIENGADFIIMDDGFQSGRVHTDYVLMVVDGHRGIGNGMCIPAGPVRAPVIDQIRAVDALLVINSGEGALPVIRMAARAAKPVYAARLEAMDDHGLAGARVLAFSGIGDNEKFFRSLREIGAELVDTRSFGDHHPYSDAEIAEIVAEADSKGLQLVTTAKDAMRLANGTHAANSLLAKVRLLLVEVVFDDKDRPARLVEETVTRYRMRAVQAR
jgi:tetraacyldisaccharide 4'-kinase